MNNNYEIVQTISENVFQRLMECRGENGEIFYNNVITGSGLIKLIDTDKLKRLPTNIIECYRTGDRIYIMTEVMDFESLKDYAAEGKLTFRQQFALSRAVMELADDIYGMSDVVQQKILDFDSLKIDSNGNIFINCTFEFEQDYDISENETFKRLGNIIHYIFAGTEIVDYNISDSIPPDVLKIVVRCLTKEYMQPRDALNELIKSPIYNMMNLDMSMRIPAEEKPEERALRSSIGRYSNDREILAEVEAPMSEPSDDEANVLNIYIDTPAEAAVKELMPAKRESSDEDIGDDSPRFGNMDLRKKGFIGIVALGVALMLFFAVRGLLVNDDSTVSGTNGDGSGTAANTTGQGVDKDTDAKDIQDTTTKYFNNDLLQVIQYTGVKAKIDNEVYVEGKNSLMVENDSEEEIKALIAAINLKDESYSYMIKKPLSVYFKANCQTDLDITVDFEAYKDGEMSNNFHVSSLKVESGYWMPVTFPANMPDADSLLVYVRFSGINKVWVDDISIDVTK